MHDFVQYERGRLQLRDIDIRHADSDQLHHQREQSTYQPGSAIELGDTATAEAVNCTIAFNGFGVQNPGNGTFYALNTIIANNGTGPTNGDFAGTFTSQGYNLIGHL